MKPHNVCPMLNVERNDKDRQIDTNLKTYGQQKIPYTFSNEMALDLFFVMEKKCLKRECCPGDVVKLPAGPGWHMPRLPQRLYKISHTTSVKNRCIAIAQHKKLGNNTEVLHVVYIIRL